MSRLHFPNWHFALYAFRRRALRSALSLRDLPVVLGDHPSKLGCLLCSSCTSVRLSTLRLRYSTFLGIHQSAKCVPKQNLAQDLAAAAVIKVEMTELLRELETKVTGRTIKIPGGWRHHPVEWTAAHPPRPAPNQDPAT